MTIIVSHLRDWTKPDKIARRHVEWGIGCTPRELAPDWAEPGDLFVGCSRNGALVTDWDTMLADGDHVHYWARPGGPAIVGPALAAGQIVAASSALAGIFSALAISLAGSLLLKVLFPLRKPAKPGDQDSSANAFHNLQQNVRGEGAAIPVVYGRTRVSPPIISEYIRSGFDLNGNPTSEYLALMLIGEGPIYAIGDKTADGGPFTSAAGNALQTLELNNQPAANFEGVEAHVRLGDLDQTAISEFSDPVLQFSVDKTLRDSNTLTHATTPTDTTSSTTAIAAYGSFASGDANITKWDTHERYISGDQADEFAAILEFPQGLIGFSTSTGAEQANSVIVQARYRQVDDGGVGFGNYVVLPAQQIKLTRRGLARVEIRRKFFDPAAYSPPNFGFYAIARAAGVLANPGISYAAVAGTFTPATPATLQFSFACWVRRRSVLANSATTRIFQWFGSNKGFQLNLKKNSSGTDASLELLFGDGSTIISTGAPNGFLSVADDVSTSLTPFGWHHIAATYEASFDGTNTRLRYFLDGVQVGSVQSSQRATLDSTQPILLMSNSTGSPTLGFDGHMDEATLWSRALTPYEIAAMFNGASPQSVDDAANGLIIGARFDDNPTTGHTTAFGPYEAIGTDWILGSGTNGANDPDISSAGDPQGGFGLVRTPEGGTPLRGKYLVDVMRLDTEDTAFNLNSEIVFRWIQLRTFQDYTYPGMALLALRVPSNDQLEGGAPLMTVRVDGRLVPVWDGVNPTAPNFDPTYSRNPAWVSVDAVMNKEYGLGGAYQRATDIDVQQLAAAAAVWDTLIYDNLGRTAFLEAQYRDSSEEPTLGVVFGDLVRYRVATLPSGYPSFGALTETRYLKPILTGLAPSPPAWLTTQAGLVAQQAVFVLATGSQWWIYTRTTQTLGAGQTAYTVSSGQTADNGLEGHDVRARFDGVFDRTDFPAWDAVIQILNTARGAPMRIGSRFSVFYDDVSQPVALITMGNIVEGTWKQGFMGVSDRYNAESGEINDELLNWERTPYSDEHPDITDPGSSSSFRFRRVALEGITRRGQAKRYMRRDLNIFKLVRRWCSFELGIDSIPLEPGAVLAISHDVPQYGFSGRIYADSTNTTVKLDRSITLAGATSYQVQVRDSASGNRYTVAVTQAAGTYAAGTALTVAAFPSSFAPAKDDLYALGEVSKGETKLFRLVDYSLDPRAMTVRCRCLEYDAQVYSDDFGSLPVIGASALPVPNVPTVPPGVQNLSVSELTVKGPDGSIRIGASVSFEHYPETFRAVGWTDIYVSAGGYETGIGAARLVASLSASDVHADISSALFERNQTYTVWVVPRTRDGATAYRTAISFVEFTPNGLAVPPFPPAGLRAHILGERAVYRWEDNGTVPLDQGAIVEARQGGWILGVPLFAVPAQARQSPPTVWNGAPTSVLGVAETPIYCRTKLKNGQYSKVAELSFVPTVEGDGNVLAVNEEDGPWT